MLSLFMLTMCRLVAMQYKLVGHPSVGGAKSDQVPTAVTLSMWEAEPPVCRETNHQRLPAIKSAL